MEAPSSAFTDFTLVLPSTAGTAAQVLTATGVGGGTQWTTPGASAFGSAEFWQLGAQPGSIAAGQSFTFMTDAVAPTGDISKIDALATNLNVATGSVITLANIGRYEVSF